MVGLHEAPNFQILKCWSVRLLRPDLKDYLRNGFREQCGQSSGRFRRVAASVSYAFLGSKHCFRQIFGPAFNREVGYGARQSQGGP